LFGLQIFWDCLGIKPISVKMRKWMGFGIFTGFQVVDSYRFLFASRRMKYTNICKSANSNVSET